jgi:hypothetical protein
MKFHEAKTKLLALFSKERSLQIQANKACRIISEANYAKWTGLIDKQQWCFDEQERVLAQAKRDMPAFESHFCFFFTYYQLEN